MGLIKDGNVYRTEYEQLVHLTEKHLEQKNINSNVNRQLQDLSVASNLGGYNFVRFAFQKQGTYYKLSNELLDNNIEGSEVNDYFEITSGVDGDIPAYGYLNEDNKIAIAFFGDFLMMYSILNVRNVTKNILSTISVNYTEFDGTGLLDYNPQEKAKQLFNVYDDLEYGGRTQYASFDLNNDGIYNYVFIGTVKNGRDGYSVYTVNEQNLEEITQKLSVGDQIISTFDGVVSDIEVIVGDVLEFNSLNNFTKIGNIRGEKGEKGETGEQGEQGIQGVQGVQGAQGVQGLQGEKGQNAPVLNLISYLENSGLLPDFSTANNGDAYVVINTSGATIAYDLYFKGSGSNNWQIIPNFGPLKGDTGPQGPAGPQGIQGVQGIQGERGYEDVLYSRNIVLRPFENIEFYAYLYFIDNIPNYTKTLFFRKFANSTIPRYFYATGIFKYSAGFDTINRINISKLNENDSTILINISCIRASDTSFRAQAYSRQFRVSDLFFNSINEKIT